MSALYAIESLLNLFLCFRDNDCQGLLVLAALVRTWILNRNVTNVLRAERVGINEAL